MGLIASCIGTSLGFTIKSERKAAINGLHGYNGYLFGMGVGYFNTGLSMHSNSWYDFGILSPVVVLGGVICFLIHVALMKSLSSPPFTFAYNITLSCWLAYACSLSSMSDLSPVFVSGTTESQLDSWISFGEIDFGWFVRTTLAGVGQVFFSPELTSSIVITSALAIGSPIAAILAIMGSAIGTLIALVTQGSVYWAENGIYGLSAVLASIGLGGFYFVFSWWSVLLAFLGSVLSVWLSPLVAGLFVRPGGPCMTFPFCIAATFLYFAMKHLGRPIMVPSSILHAPEDSFIERRNARKIFERHKETSEELDERERKLIQKWPDLSLDQ
jgi:urea transporter